MAFLSLKRLNQALFLYECHFLQFEGVGLFYQEEAVHPFD